MNYTKENVEVCLISFSRKCIPYLKSCRGKGKGGARGGEPCRRLPQGGGSKRKRAIVSDFSRHEIEGFVRRGKGNCVYSEEKSQKRDVSEKGVKKSRERTLMEEREEGSILRDPSRGGRVVFSGNFGCQLA